MRRGTGSLGRGRREGSLGPGAEGHVGSSGSLQARDRPANLSRLGRRDRSVFLCWESSCSPSAPDAPRQVAVAGGSGPGASPVTLSPLP